MDSANTRHELPDIPHSGLATAVEIHQSAGGKNARLAVEHVLETNATLHPRMPAPVVERLSRHAD